MNNNYRTLHTHISTRKWQWTTIQLAVALLYLDYLFSWYSVQFLRQEIKWYLSIRIGLYHMLHVLYKKHSFCLQPGCFLSFLAHNMSNQKMFCVKQGPCYLLFWIGIHSMQDWTAAMKNGVTRKRSSKRLKHIGNLFRKNIQLIGCFFFNWDSLHTWLNSHYEAWSYKKRSIKKFTGYRKSV